MMIDMCLAIADYIIKKTNEYNSNTNQKVIMTCKRLMKIIYFCDAEYMRVNGSSKSMIKDDYYAWESGPVLPNIYLKYVHFQNGTMLPLKETYKELGRSITSIIDKILELTFDISTEKLIKISHRSGSPWATHSSNYGKIPKEEIFNYYGQMENVLQEDD